MTKQLPRSRQSMLALGLGLLLIMARRQIAQITMEEVRHEQQMFALILANSLAESFETTRVLQLMSRLMTRHGQLMDDFPADTNISMFNAHGTPIANIATTGIVSQPVDLRGVISGAMVSTSISGRARLPLRELGA